MFKKITFLTITIFLLSAVTANAVGVSVIPSKLLIETQTNRLATEILTIKNPSSIVSIYDVYPDEYDEWVKISPSSFTLEANETRQVNLQVRPKQAGLFVSHISVVAKPLSVRRFQANSGLKIPVEIRVVKPEQNLGSFIWNEILSLVNIILAIYALSALFFLNFVIKKMKKYLSGSY